MSESHVSDSERRRSYRGLAILLVVVLLGGAGVAVVATQSEKTRDCTIEALEKVRVRKAPDYTRVVTAECGDIRAYGDALRNITSPDCPYDTAKVGGRYIMTTTGYDVPLPWVQQRLAKQMILLEAAPNATCLSDIWLTDD